MNIAKQCEDELRIKLQKMFFDNFIEKDFSSEETKNKMVQEVIKITNEIAEKYSLPIGFFDNENNKSALSVRLTEDQKMEYTLLPYPKKRDLIND